MKAQCPEKARNGGSQGGNSQKAARRRAESPGRMPQEAAPTGETRRGAACGDGRVGATGGQAMRG